MPIRIKVSLAVLFCHIRIKNLSLVSYPMLSHSGGSRRALHPRCRWEEWEVLTEVAKDASFLASDDRRLFDENFAAALALLDVPEFQQYKSGLSSSWQR